MNVGFQEIVISVFNIAQFAEAFVEIGCYSFHPLPDASHEQYVAWHVPPACNRIEQALLKAENDDKGWIRLVKFHGVDQRVMRSSHRSWDTGGIFDLDLYTVDARASYAALQRLGWTAFGEPFDFRFGELHVCQVVAMGPAGLSVALIQAFSPRMVTLPPFRAWSRAFNSTQIVSDHRRAMNFYLDKLGWKTLFDFTFEKQEEPSYSVLGVPRPYAKETGQNLSIVHPEGTNDGSVELIGPIGLSGEDFARHCIAPNVGYLSYRFPLSKLDAQADLIQSRGVSLYTPPQDLVIEPYGKCRLFSVRTPDGAIVEFFEAEADRHVYPIA